ncbi:hypothetical protein PDIDSM_9179 [Penicillium digitatum]|nr:hypothetical protein PDIDSM_9179 [Penicillium digitatum]
MEDTSLEKGLQQPPAEAPKAAPPVPEGGLQAWLTAEYETNQLKNYSSSDVSWITSMEFFFMLFTSPVAGTLFDGYGPRVPIAIGSVLHVFG